jgi:dTDP-4-amino-4,6-dideoxygalactose transaminase
VEEADAFDGRHLVRRGYFGERERGVQTVINYPTALHFLEAYSRLNARPEQFPNAHRDQGRILSLPMFAVITGEQQNEVIDLIRKF